jgi:hypothetical protein
MYHPPILPNIPHLSHPKSKERGSDVSPSRFFMPDGKIRVMNFSKKLLTSFVVFVFSCLVVTSPAYASCTVNNCNPVFSKTADLSQPITEVVQKSLSAFSPGDVYVGYEMSCTGSETVTIPYCPDAWSSPSTNFCQFSKSDAQKVGYRTVNGKNYFVSKIPASAFTQFAPYYPSAFNRLYKMQTNLWTSSNQWMCAQDANLPARYLSENCNPLAVNPSRTTEGKFFVPVTVNTTNLVPGKSYDLIIAKPHTLDIIDSRATSFTVDANHTPIQQGFQDVVVPDGTYHVCVVAQGVNNVTECAASACFAEIQLTQALPTATPVFASTPPTTGGGDYQAADFKLCEQVAPEDRGKCTQCVGGDNIEDPDNAGFWTAFGCVKTSKEGIVQNIIQIGLGLAGGFVLLSILYGAFLLTTSSGDAKRVQEGQEMITSAVMGLVFVIFSIMILQFIGVSILRIPGFGGP